MKRYWLIFFSISVYFFLCHSCSQNESSFSSNPIDLPVPDGWPKPFYDLKGNGLTKERIALGKKLFFDKRLSLDSSISCGSCHLQEKAFSDAGNKFSKGIRNLAGTRNSPGLFNLAWNKTFMWDGGVNHIEFQPLVPLTSEVEMGETLNNVLKNLNNSTEYKTLFKRAYNSDSITSQLLLRAFAQFLSTIVSADSKYDKVKKGDKLFSFSTEEQMGYTLFKQNCSTCHKEPLFTDHSFRNNGIGVDSLNDPGRFIITHVSDDSLKFKVPSLRNILFTAPYMHDGRFKTLHEVMGHYSDAVHHKNTDPKIVLIPKFTTKEKINLISFLKTLSDSSFIEEPRFKE
jgi:cytochrome c peroxidase